MTEQPTAFVAAALMVVACSVMATDYPTRPIRVVDPFAPGGSTEAQVRALGAKLTEAWGQPVVIEARPGAGSALGSQLVAQWTADGGAGSARFGAWMRPGSGLWRAG